MHNLFYIGIGGFLGANARYALSQAADRMLAPHWGVFPYGTLVVNVLGSFGLALFRRMVQRAQRLVPTVAASGRQRLFGAFTTFSAFANESFTLLREGTVEAFALNLLLNNGLCLLGVALGLALGQRLLRRYENLSGSADHKDAFMLENIIKVVILSCIEGVTEFLPISSTGHLIVGTALLNFDEMGSVFEIFIQFWRCNGGGLLLSQVVARKREPFRWRVGIG